jgi:phosphoadenosine phosphosulfate reductase
MDKLGVGTWITGLRQSQSRSRKNIQALDYLDDRFKLMPIYDWDNRMIHQYLKQHNLPYHPLWDEGYVSIGDRHTSRPLTADMIEEDTRFFGQLRECGIHSELA